MKTLISAVIAMVAFTMSTSAQSNIEIGISGGATNYFGDLGNNEVLQSSSSNNEVLQSTSTRPGGAITIRNFLNSPAKTGYQYQPLSVEARFSWHRIGYDETKSIGDKKGYQLRNYGRGLSFRTDVYGVSTHVSYTLYANKRKPLYATPIKESLYMHREQQCISMPVLAFIMHDQRQIYLMEVLTSITAIIFGVMAPSEIRMKKADKAM